MKIIAYPFIPAQTCHVCHSLISLTVKDLKNNPATLVKDSYKCPVCGCLQYVKYEYGWKNCTPTELDVVTLKRAIGKQKECDKMKKEFNK